MIKSELKGKINYLNRDPDEGGDLKVIFQRMFFIRGKKMRHTEMKLVHNSSNILEVQNHEQTDSQNHDDKINDFKSRVKMEGDGKYYF